MTSLSSTVELIRKSKKHVKAHLQVQCTCVAVRVVLLLALAGAIAFYFSAEPVKPPSSTQDATKVKSVISRLIPQ